MGSITLVINREKLASNLHPIDLSLQDVSAWLHDIIKAEMVVKHGKLLSQPNKSVAGPRKPTKMREEKASPPPPTILATFATHTKIEEQNSSDVSEKSGNIPDPKRCPLCKNGHPLKRCPRFEAKSVAERAETVKELRACFRCLRNGHRSRDCYSKKKCGVDGCTYLHHQLLYGVPKVFPAPKSDTNSECNEEEKEVKFAELVGSAAFKEVKSSVLLAVVLVTINNGDQKMNTFALLDSGSEATLILSSAAKKIKTDGSVADITLATFHGEDPNLEIKRVQFSIAS